MKEMIMSPRFNEMAWKQAEYGQLKLLYNSVLTNLAQARRELAYKSDRRFGSARKSAAKSKIQRLEQNAALVGEQLRAKELELAEFLPKIKW